MTKKTSTCSTKRNPFAIGAIGAIGAGIRIRIRLRLRLRLRIARTIAAASVWTASLWTLSLLTAASSTAWAERAPVLAQIDLPHPYYFREMYLPQLTSGPSSVAWAPDSREVVYSMAGSLWRQAFATGIARQLTAAAAYDYQPDWSPDGRWIVYSSYRADAVELWLFDTQSATAQPLLQNGAVNVEARFSPDGKRIVFVSTAFNKRFHVFCADIADGKLSTVQRLTGEHASDLPRYYYSPFDHEISPVWSRDGKEIIYVSNRGHIYGTGGFWRMPAQAGAQAREIHYEETNWKARPELSPDGSRMVFASYLGRSWHNLWVMPSGGGDAFALTFADWDQTNPRWAPDGLHVAFISNRSGNTEIGIVSVPGGEIRSLKIDERRYLSPMSHLHLVLHGVAGADASARISVTNSAGRFYAPQDAWIHADDGFDRSQRSFEAHYFHVQGEANLDVPAGTIDVEIMHGFQRRLQHLQVQTVAQGRAELSVEMNEGTWAVPADGHWVSGDVHVHMNYGGAYRNVPSHLVMQARAENLNVVEALVVNKEVRFPDIAYSGLQQDPASQAPTLIVHGQEFHTSYWGHMGLLNIGGGVILPGYVGYPNTAAASLSPTNADVADLAHAKGALVGYVHPFDDPPHPYAKLEKLTNELPVDVALGKVDYMEILGFSDHRATADVWYRLLNLGFRIPAAGGTDAMADFASLRGPVGMNRVYVRVPDGVLKSEDFLDGIKHGRTFATNGPLLGFTLAGAGVGSEVNFDRAQNRIAFHARLQSIVAVDHLDLICNGRLVRSFVHGKALAQGDFSGTLPIQHSGWCVLRAMTIGARYPVLDNYVYATTSPIYVTIAGRKPRSREDADFFSAWIDRIAETTDRYPDWNDAAEKAHVMQQLATAKAVYGAMR
jgi:TolB protein